MDAFDKTAQRRFVEAPKRIRSIAQPIQEINTTSQQAATSTLPVACSSDALTAGIYSIKPTSGLDSVPKCLYASPNWYLQLNSHQASL